MMKTIYHTSMVKPEGLKEVDVTEFQDCIGKECAWWGKPTGIEDTTKNCAINAIARALWLSLD